MLNKLFISAINRNSVAQRRMASSNPTVQAVHNPSAKRFEIVFPDKDIALLEYEEVKPGHFDFYHTEVPSSKQGQGLGAKLADASMEWIKKNDYKAYLSCSYLRDNWLPRHPEYKNHTVSNL